MGCKQAVLLPVVLPDWKILSGCQQAVRETIRNEAGAEPRLAQLDVRWPQRRHDVTQLHGPLDLVRLQPPAQVVPQDAQHEPAANACDTQQLDLETPAGCSDILVAEGHGRHSYCDPLTKAWTAAVGRWAGKPLSQLPHNMRGPAPSSCSTRPTMETGRLIQ